MRWQPPRWASERRIRRARSPARTQRRLSSRSAGRWRWSRERQPSRHPGTTTQSRRRWRFGIRGDAGRGIPARSGIVRRAPGPRGIVERAGGQIGFGALLRPAVGAGGEQTARSRPALSDIAMIALLLRAMTAVRGRLVMTALRTVGALVMAIRAMVADVGPGRRLMEAPALTHHRCNRLRGRARPLSAVARIPLAAGTAPGTAPPPAPGRPQDGPAAFKTASRRTRG